MLTRVSPTGFGLISVMLVVFIVLAIIFGFQKLQPSPASDDASSLGTYQPITPDILPGQIEAGYQVKDNTQTTIKNLQDRVSRDVSGSE